MKEKPMRKKAKITTRGDKNSTFDKNFSLVHLKQKDTSRFSSLALLQRELLLHQRCFGSCSRTKKFRRAVISNQIAGVPRHIDAKLFRSAKQPFFRFVIDDKHIACPPRDKVIELAVDRDGHQIACSIVTQLGSFLGLKKSSSVPVKYSVYFWKLDKQAFTLPTDKVKVEIKILLLGKFWLLWKGRMAVTLREQKQTTWYMSFVKTALKTWSSQAWRSQQRTNPQQLPLRVWITNLAYQRAYLTLSLPIKGFSIDE